MDPRGLRVTHNAYFSLLTHTKKLLLVTFCDPTAKTGFIFWTNATDGMDGTDGTHGTDRTDGTDGRNGRTERTDGTDRQT